MYTCFSRLSQGLAMTKYSVVLTAAVGMQALYDLHKREYFHRDLKPLNVVVSGWSAEKLRGTLVDWASARHKDEGVSICSACKSQLVFA